MFVSEGLIYRFLGDKLSAATAVVICAIVVAPIVEEIFRKWGGWSFTMWIILFEGIMYSLKAGGYVYFFNGSIGAAIIAALLIWTSRSAHIMFQVLVLNNNNGIIKAILMHSFYNTIVVGYSSYYNIFGLPEMIISGVFGTVLTIIYFMFRIYNCETFPSTKMEIIIPKEG